MPRPKARRPLPANLDARKAFRLLSRLIDHAERDIQECIQIHDMTDPSPETARLRSKVNAVRAAYSLLRKYGLD